MKSKSNWAVLLVATLFLGGCAASAVLRSINKSDLNMPACVEGGFITDSDFSATDETADFSKLSTKWISGGLGNGIKINKFLDCIIVDLDTRSYEAIIKSIGTDAFDDKAKTKKELLEELYLYRGHVVVTLLARYGAFNVTGQVGSAFDIEFSPYQRGPQDAVSILTRIEKAEKGLRKASSVVGGASTANKKLPTVERLHRVADIIQVAVAVERPTIRRARGFIEKLIVAFGGGAPSGLDALKDAINGMKKLVVLEFFTAAYLTDVKIDLADFLDKNTKPEVSDWNEWSKSLNEACTRLAAFASAENHCTGS